jgi:hypothetical protein
MWTPWMAFLRDGRAHWFLCGATFPIHGWRARILEQFRFSDQRRAVAP